MNPQLVTGKPYVGHIIIGLDHGQEVIIPTGISREDFECIKKTLDLWESRIVDKSKLTPEEIEIDKVFGQIATEPLSNDDDIRS